MTGFEPAPAVRLIERWLPIANVGDGYLGERRVLTAAGVPPASAGCGPALVRLRAGHERSQGESPMMPGLSVSPGAGRSA